MGINWIKVEEKMPVDNGKIQKFLVCTTMKTSVFQNCDIRTCYKIAAKTHRLAYGMKAAFLLLDNCIE